MFCPFGAEWLGFPFMPVIPIIFFALFAVMFWRCRKMCRVRQNARRTETARDILDSRYAKGELGREEYQAMRKDLE